LKMIDPDDLQKKLDQTLNECARLKAENNRLKKLLNLPLEIEENPPPLKITIAELPSSYSLPEEGSVSVTNDSTHEAKIALFRSLFYGRQDVYPVRWERKDGKSGYSPACALEWKRPLCGKPAIKCGECKNRKLLPLTNEVIHGHLTGKNTIGIYPLLQDETCRFLAADFDKKTWLEDARAFFETCAEMGIPSALERSRSGIGGHIWIFFEAEVPASLARKLGFSILTRTLEKHYQMGMDSYDRFFPNQDTLPKGGFGNLIALPLQWVSRAKGNSVFIDEEGIPYPDQWLFLSGIQKLPLDKAEALVAEYSRLGKIIPVRITLTGDTDEPDPWTLPPSGKRRPKNIVGPMPQQVEMVQADQIYISKKNLPPVLTQRLIESASFQNPEFFRAQAMRFPVYNKPRVICCAENFPKHIGLPRGCLDEALSLFGDYGITVDCTDQRFRGLPIDIHFKGTLHPPQERATQAILNSDNGILSAPTAFGKTVVAAWLIAFRKVNTLVLVHRLELLTQWRKRLASFLNLPLDQIGQIGGGKERITHFIDVGILQSLNRKGVVKDGVAGYGQIIVDECHHIPAVSFEQVLKKCKARYVLGLTTTPIRKDGHHPIIIMQCGPIRFRENLQKAAAAQPFEHVVIPRVTAFKAPINLNSMTIQDIYQAIIQDRKRNDLIFQDLLATLESGRSPLLLTERKEHLSYLASRLEGFARNVIVLRGGLENKQRQQIEEQMKSIPDGEERIILATGRYIGEGFDDSRLDTLFLVMPISWRGTLEQYVGRLHRLHENKRVVQVYDYIDSQVPVLMKMFQKRIKGYKAIGYQIKDGNGSE
jgi:superfamily II DNA or RNA helicase